jgi:putative acetyltransferase
VIRPIVVGDAEAVAPLARAARLEAIPGLPDLHTPAEDLAFYRSEIGAKPGLVWEDESGGIAGFVIWDRDMVDHLYVTGSRQRSGVGTRLLEAAVAEMGVAEVRLWAFQGNARAVAFYARRGFSILEATDGSGNEERLPDYLLGRAAGTTS